jgi:hypothetical protein
MDFDKIHDLASHIPDKIDKIKNEDAAKMAFVQPFIIALGYDIHDPDEVMPEYPIFESGKKNEYADYAILRDGEPIILIECKWNEKDITDLSNIDFHIQLNKYYNQSPAKFGILTNGVIYKFFSDLDETNKMDKMPFLEFDLRNIKDPIMNDANMSEIKIFSKPMDANEAYKRAQDLRYIKEIRNLLENEFKEPSEDFVRFVAEQVYKGPVLTKKIVDKFSKYTKMTCNQFIQDKMNNTWKAAQKLAQPTSPDIIGDMESESKGPKYFIFNGERFEVKFWKDMLPKICSIMASRHKDRFEEVLNIRGNKNPYFSKNKDDLTSPELVEGTDIYAETWFSKNGLLRQSKKVISLFTYPEDAIYFGEDQE